MQHLKHHAAHLLMCAPMLVVALVLIAGGAGLASLVPVIACMLMMGVMMGGMMGAMRGHGHGRRESGDQR